MTNDDLEVKLIGERKLPVGEPGKRQVLQPRYNNSSVAGYNNLLLVVRQQPSERMKGKVAVALFDAGSVDPAIVCDLFPKAHAAWRDLRLAQHTLFIPRQRDYPEPQPLGRARVQFLKPGSASPASQYEG